MSIALRALALPATLGLAAAPLAQQVFTVGTLPGDDYDDLQQAILCVAPGDTLLLRTRSFKNFQQEQPFELSRSVRIVSEVPGGAQIESPLLVRDLGPADTVVLRGLELDGSAALDAHTGIEILDCDGNVWIEDCSMEPGLFVLASTIHGLTVTNSANVVLLRSSFTCADLSFGTGLLATGSHVRAYDSSFSGSSGSAPESVGVRVVSGIVELFGSTAIGAEGDDGGFFGTCATDGAAGLLVEGGLVETLDSSLVGGAPGRANPCATTPMAGPSTTVVGGSLTTLSGASRSFEVSSPVTSGGTVTVQLEGENGDLAYVLFSSDPATFAFPQWTGALLLGPALDGFAVGTLSGPTTVFATAPSLPVGAVDTLYLQGVFFTFPGVTFGPASVLTTTGP